MREGSSWKFSDWCGRAIAIRTMLVLNVYYKVKPGMREAFLEAVKEIKVPELSRAEEGNFKYDYYFSQEDADEVLLVEHWKDDEALKAHMAQPHFNSLGAIKEEFLIDLRIEKMVG